MTDIISILIIILLCSGFYLLGYINGKISGVKEYHEWDHRKREKLKD